MGYVEGLLGDGEQIVMRTRRHWMVLAGAFVRNLIVAAIILAAALVGAAFVGPLALVVLVALLYPLFEFGRRFLDWYNEEYMVTNRRVIQAEGVINKHVIDSSLEKVNDVVLNQSVLGRLFNYGDIEILTASELGVNKLHTLGGPVKFKTVMLNQKEALGSDESFGHPRSNEHAHDVPDLIAELDELRKQGVLTEAEFQQKKAELLAKM